MCSSYCYQLLPICQAFLSDNQLSGSIPAELGNLGHLWEFNLSENQLSGVILPELGNLRSLWHLYLDNNNLTGLIPSELGNLSLEVLHLNGNKLSGSMSNSIPPESNRMRELYLNNNQLCGSIPTTLKYFTELEYLRLENNGLNISNLGRGLKAFLSGLYDATWEPQDPSICSSLATLATFEAISNSKKVLLKWQTLVEDKNAGYFIWRGQPNNSQCTSHPENYHDIVLVGFEASKSNGFSETTYLYQDNAVKPKTTYCYLLEDRDFGGNSTFHWDSIVSVTTD